MTKILTLFLFLSPLAANAASLQDLQVQELDQIVMSEYKLPASASLINVKYSGSEASNEINVSSGDMNLEAPVGTVVVNYSLSAAPYDTIGELCDAINTNSYWSCKQTGGKRDDSSVLMADVAAQSVSAAAGYDIGIGTGTVEAAETIQYINRVGITPQAGRRVILKYCDVQTDAVGTLAIYGKLRKYATVADGVTRNDTTLVASMATANDTAEVDGNVYDGGWLEFAKDAHVVISAGNVATAQTATSYLNCFWDEK